MGASGTYGIELAAPGTIDARKAEDVHGDAMRPAHLLPAAFRIEAPPRAGTARTGLAPFVHPGAAAITVDAGGRQIAHPPERRSREAHDVTAVRRQRRVAFVVRRRSEEHTSELQSLMRISYAVFCLKKKN